jgi:hypothetical protein
MPQEVKLWRVSGDKLEPHSSAALDLEENLERWIEADISVLSPDLLVIGRQVLTDHGGKIDLLCLDSNGNTVVIELKRDKTPRDVVAQLLDYASWVRGLSSARISEIADAYLGGKASLEDAFAEKFNEDLPDLLNEDHRMLVVGSRIDASTERIIASLSEAHRVGINAASFQFLKDPSGGTTLARVFLIEPGQVDQQVRGRASSKRRPRRTEEELLQDAEEAEVGSLYGSTGYAPSSIALLPVGARCDSSRESARGTSGASCSA